MLKLARMSFCFSYHLSDRPGIYDLQASTHKVTYMQNKYHVKKQNYFYNLKEKSYRSYYQTTKSVQEAAETKCIL